MRRYSTTAWERAMKIQDVILRAMAKKITWWQAAEIIGISDRSMRRWKRRYERLRLRRIIRPALRQAQPEAGAAEGGGRGAASLWREVLRT